MSLCPEAEMRAAMTDGEFWQHVFHGDDGPDDPCDVADSWDAYRDAFGLPSDLPVTPCEVCGSGEEACGYDAEGRPMIHATEHEAEDAAARYHLPHDPAGRFTPRARRAPQ